MEKLSNILTDYLIQRNVISAEKSRIYVYGFQIGLEVSLNTIISIIIAVLFHMEMETLIFFTVFALLRSYAGGLHLNTYIGCLICSCMSLLGLLLAVKYLNLDNSLAIEIVCISLLLIKFISPVQDINRPISSSEMQKFGKMLNYSIIKIVIIAVIFYLLKFDRLLLMITATVVFTVGILVLGKVNYKKCIRESK